MGRETQFARKQKPKLYHRMCRSSLLFTVVVTLFRNGAVSAQDLRSEDLYRKMISSVMTLNITKQDGSQGIGSAFLALKEGLAVTSWHVVKDVSHVVARFSSGEEFEVSGVVDKDEKRDVAIIRVKVFGRPVLVLNSAEPAIGAKVYVIGAPKGLEFSISDGLLSQIQVFEGTKQLQVSCPVSPGNSGGPLFNSKGEVIGVVSWQLREGQNLNFAVPAVYVLGLDNSLPTKPWTEVRSTTPSLPKQAAESEVDKLFSEILVLQLDLTTALVFTETMVVRKKNGFKTGVPPFLYSLNRELKEKQKMLSSLFIQDSVRAALASKLQASTGYMIESSDLLIEAVKTAQSNGGWVPESNDLLSRSYAANELLEIVPPEDLRQVPPLIEIIPSNAKPILGLENDSTDFRLGVYTWLDNPLMLVAVPEKSLAHWLGFRSGDFIVSINETKGESISQVKKLIKANVGKNIAILVRRNGERLQFKAKIPEKLQKE